MQRVRGALAATLGLLAAGCGTGPVSVASSVPVADSVRDFAGAQGAGGWWYGVWDRSADADGTYEQAVDFALLPHFGADPLNGLSGRPELGIGPLWFLQDGVSYTALWAGGGHPNGAQPLGMHVAAEQWAVRRWVSTVDGQISITGHAGKHMPWGRNWRGGCRGLIVVDGRVVFSAFLDEQGTDYTLQATVARGSLVDFLIGPGPEVGVIAFTTIIRR
jgi:hypothetical protein